MSALANLKDLRSSIHSTLTANPEEAIFTKVLDELRGAGGEITKDVALVMEIVKQKTSGKPMDDRTMMMERIIQLVAKLPETSFTRKKVTGVLVDQLWDSLQHPPLSYVGDKYQYRQPDGSHNNIMYPELGKAGTPYARTVRSETMNEGARPDPGLLFDLLMSRGDGFKENEAGISSMLLYHASIITHDVFHTSRKDTNISDTSSYLDLAPLYGSNLTDQQKIRTFKNGEIKPDTFSEKRLLGFPPGVNVMLIMYSRFHNYAARTLAAINQGGRFTLSPRLDPEAAQIKRDNDLFQVARLVTNGLYVNISLHDYIRAIANINSTESSWTLDPRVDSKKAFDKEGTPRGVGNQVSCEFNLLYRFHSAISKRDEKWTHDFYAQLFPGQDPLKLSVPALLQGIGRFESSINHDPSKRTFAGLERQPDGTFKDEDLVKILKESVEDPAGGFGANNVPNILKTVEILGIIQARKWEVASLNEFRQFFDLKKYETFEEINPDPYVAETLRRLYEHPDHVEMYPGMFLEAAKPRMDPGMGLCAPYTVTRAVFSDAITLVRGDRFLTLDYTPANLTNWGITEVAQDLETLGGSKMHLLMLNAFPRWFKFNSVYVMQPFYTPTESRKIFTKYDKMDLYSFDPPTLEPPLIPVVSHAALRAVLADQKNFKVPWGAKMTSLGNYMLAGDHVSHTAQRNVVNDMVYGVDGALDIFRDYAEQITLKLLRREAHVLGRDSVYQVDIVKHVGNLAAVHFASALCYLPLLDGSANSYTENEMYKVLCDLTTYVFSDADPTKSWARRRDSQRGTAKLCSIMEGMVKQLQPLESTASCPVSPQSPPKTVLGGALGFARKRVALRAGQAKALVGSAAKIVSLQSGGGQETLALADYGETFARKLLGAKKSAAEIAQILVGTASAFVANTATAFAQIIDFFLLEENATHWAEMQRLAKEDTPEADQILTKYTLEGARLSNSLGVLRIVEPATGQSVNIEQYGQTITAKKGDRLFVSFIAASRDPTVFPNPLEIRLDRPAESYITFGEGPHQCLGKEMNIVYNLAMIKVLARLNGLRRSPGDTGRLKCITKPGGIKLYMTPEWNSFTPYPTTMRLMFDGAP